MDDNWVSFAGFYWCIIRTNSDGSIRMIYVGTDPNVTTGAGTQIQTSAFNIEYDASYYVGLKYTIDEQHGNTTDSTIMGVLNTWYSNNLASQADKLTSGTGFCGDREMTSGYSWSATSNGITVNDSFFYSTYERLGISKKPILECITIADTFTTRNAKIGNEGLQYPVGLITADEVAMAGGRNGANNRGYYLYTNQSYWTMSPFGMNAVTNAAVVFFIDSSGHLNTSSVSNINGIRPVINLRADVTLSGTGTASDPYVVS